LASDFGSGSRRYAYEEFIKIMKLDKKLQFEEEALSVVL